MARDDLIEDIKANTCEIIAAVSVLGIALSLLYLRTRDVPSIMIALFGCAGIIMLGLEKRANMFDRVVSMLVILVLAIGFMFLS